MYVEEKPPCPVFYHIVVRFLTQLSIIEVAITIICSCAPAIFSLCRHLFADSSSFASVRSKFTRSQTSTPSHSGDNPHKSYNSVHGEPRLPPEEAGYVELGAFSGVERQLSSHVYERRNGGADNKDGEFIIGTKGGQIRKTMSINVKHEGACTANTRQQWPEYTFAAEGQSWSGRGGQG